MNILISSLPSFASHWSSKLTDSKINPSRENHAHFISCKPPHKNHPREYFGPTLCFIQITTSLVEKSQNLSVAFHLSTAVPPVRNFHSCSYYMLKCNFKESYQYSIHLASSRSVLSWFQQVWQQPKAQQYQRFWWEQQAWNHQAWLIIACSSSFMHSVSEKSYGSGWLNHCSSSTRISASWGSRLSALVLTTLIKWARLTSSGDLKLSQSWSKDFQSNCESIHA